MSKQCAFVVRVRDAAGVQVEAREFSSRREAESAFDRKVASNAGIVVVELWFINLPFGEDGDKLLKRSGATPGSGREED